MNLNKLIKMKKIIYYIFNYIIILSIFIYKSKKGLCKTVVNIKSTKFILDTFDQDDSLIERYNLNFNLTTYLFNEYDDLFEL